MGNNFTGNDICVNNKSGRGYYANPCGYWESTQQFDSSKIHKNVEMNGAMFPTGNNETFNVMSNPNDRTVFGFARVGENIRNK